jgi:hypothetical protein
VLVKEGFLAARDDGKYGRVTPDSTSGRVQIDRAVLGEPPSGPQKIQSR